MACNGERTFVYDCIYTPYTHKFTMTEPTASKLLAHFKDHLKDEDNEQYIFFVDPKTDGEIMITSDTVIPFDDVIDKRGNITLFFDYIFTYDFVFKNTVSGLTKEVRIVNPTMGKIMEYVHENFGNESNVFYEDEDGEIATFDFERNCHPSWFSDLEKDGKVTLIIVSFAPDKQCTA